MQPVSSLGSWSVEGRTRLDRAWRARARDRDRNLGSCVTGIEPKDWGAY